MANVTKEVQARGLLLPRNVDIEAEIGERAIRVCNSLIHLVSVNFP